MKYYTNCLREQIIFIIFAVLEVIRVITTTLTNLNYIIMVQSILKEAISYGCGVLTIYINNQPERVDGRKVQYSDSPEMRKLLTSQGYQCKTLTYQPRF